MGAGHRHGDERHRHGAVGHPRQGGGLAALQAAGRRHQAVPAYAGGVSLGYQAPDSLVAEARAHGRGRLQGGEAAGRRHARRATSQRITAVRKALRRRHRHPDRRQHRLHGGRRAPRHAGDGRARRRLAGGAVPGARLPQLRHGHGLRQHAAGGRREPLHALRVPPRDRGRHHHHPAARPVQDRRHHRGAAHRGRRPRRGSCRSIRTAR